MIGIAVVLQSQQIGELHSQLADLQRQMDERDTLLGELDRLEGYYSTVDCVLACN